MQFSFVIVAAPGNQSRVAVIIDSIESQNIPEEDYEVIVVGQNFGDLARRKKTLVIPFDESYKPAWITQKKNLGVQQSSFQNVVLMHDYIAFNQGWYVNFCAWNTKNPNWELAITPMITQNGERWRDFTLFPGWACALSHTFSERCLLPYDFVVTPQINRYMYVSGSYYVIKRSLGIKFPLNARLVWGQAEDLEWYERIRSRGVIVRCNPDSVVRFLKPSSRMNWHKQIDEQQVELLKSQPAETKTPTLLIHCAWLPANYFSPILPDVSVRLVIDDLTHPPTKDVDLNIFCSMEPPAIRPDIHEKLKNRDWCFDWDLILTFNPQDVALPRRVKLLNINAAFWVKSLDIEEKKFGVSTIMSRRREAEGHQLRHWMREHWPSGVPSTIFYTQEPASSPEDLRQPFPADRRDCFRRMFHLTIENCRHPGYFTEKLMDCFRMKCVPIYWGAPNITDFFNPAGMIIVGHMNGGEIIKVLSELTVADYESRKEVMEENLRKAQAMNPACPENDKCERLGELIREAQGKVLDSRY